MLLNPNLVDELTNMLNQGWPDSLQFSFGRHMAWYGKVATQRTFLLTVLYVELVDSPDSLDLFVGSYSG
jgi:hypothetical protein